MKAGFSKKIPKRQRKATIERDYPDILEEIRDIRLIGKRVDGGLGVKGTVVTVFTTTFGGRRVVIEDACGQCHVRHPGMLDEMERKRLDHEWKDLLKEASNG